MKVLSISYTLDDECGDDRTKQCKRSSIEYVQSEDIRTYPTNVTISMSTMGIRLRILLRGNRKPIHIDPGHYEQSYPHREGDGMAVSSANCQRSNYPNKQRKPPHNIRRDIKEKLQ